MKRLFQAGVWRHALALVLLLVLAAVAASSTVWYLEFHPQLQEAQDVVAVVNLMLLALATGFLFLAGALGLWGIRHVAEAESRRRIGLLVDAMDYVADGVVALDARGRVVGSNQAARLMSDSPQSRGHPLSDLFPCLSSRDVACLLDKSRPREVERVLGDGHSARTLRFRSQPAGSINQVLVSDVTVQKTQQQRERQAAQMQLLGRIARGVAHDFNTILCAVSGHAALLRHALSPDARYDDSLDAITREAERGAGLARQLVDLSRTGDGVGPTESIAACVERAADLLRVSLASGWRTMVRVEDTPDPVPLAGRQVEQLVLNLGLLAAGQAVNERVLHLHVRAPGTDALWHLASPCAAVLVVAAGQGIDLPRLRVAESSSTHALQDGGLLLSVLRSMIEEAGGGLDVLQEGTRTCGFRVGLPGCAGAARSSESGIPLPAEIGSYLSGWSVLLACPQFEHRDELDRRMTSLGMNVESVDDLVSLLALVEDRKRIFTGIVMEGELLRTEMEGLLRAVRKLQPTAGLVVLPGGDTGLPDALRAQLVLLPRRDVNPADVLQALLEARERATRKPAAHTTAVAA